MAAVYVTTTNNSDQVARLLLDDERDAETVEYLKKLVRREDLKDVKVSKVPSKS